jgi:ferrous iron transport protein B
MDLAKTHKKSKKYKHDAIEYDKYYILSTNKKVLKDFLCFCFNNVEEKKNNFVCKGIKDPKVFEEFFKHHEIVKGLNKHTIIFEHEDFSHYVMKIKRLSNLRFLILILLGFVVPIILSITVLHDILVGKLIDGQVNFIESLGLITTGIFVPLGMILPYIIGFYFVLSFLEDSGYLPRLGVLIDNMMHRLGIHGLAIVPMLLGLGCNVPGAMAARILETKRERFIATTMMAIAVPCFAQLAMVVGLVGKFGPLALSLVFGTLFIVWILLGLILNKVMKGESPEMFIEIPPYRLPNFKILLKKLWMRVRSFINEAVPFMLLGVFIVNILYALHIIEFIGNLAEPLITGVMGLPKEAVGAMIIGFLRKDVAIGMLTPLNMTMGQLVIASVILTMYFPCIATFTVMLKELGWKDMIKSGLIMLLSTIIVGGVMNIFL